MIHKNLVLSHGEAAAANSIIHHYSGELDSTKNICLKNIWVIIHPFPCSSFLPFFIVSCVVLWHVWVVEGFGKCIMFANLKKKKKMLMWCKEHFHFVACHYFVEYRPNADQGDVPEDEQLQVL